MGIAELYNFYWYENADSRTTHLPLIESPIIIPTILLSYLYFVLRYGPQFMKNRKPYSLLTFVKCYNVFQIIVNLYIVQTLIDAGWFRDLPFTCIELKYGHSPSEMKIIHGLWVGFILKLVDLIETGVFVLRKKDRQVSFLHLYHHVSTIICAWLSVKYISTEMASFPLLINCCVHVMMYSYYLLSSFGERMRKTLAPVKPLITITQMIQFVLLVAYSVQTLIPSCRVPKAPGLLFIANVLINFILFYNFYHKNYSKQGQKMN